MNAGDQMLIEVSKRLIDTVRDSDSVGRFSSSGKDIVLSLIHISEPTRRRDSSRMPSSA